MLKQARLFITDIDEIAPPSATNLHFQGDIKQKTLLGGLVSLGVYLYVLYFVYQNGKKMVTYDDPSISSIEKQMDYIEVGKKYLDKLPKLITTFTHDGNSQYEYTEEDEKFIVVKLIHVEIPNSQGANAPAKRTEYKVERCTEDNFVNHEFEKMFWDAY